MASAKKIAEKALAEARKAEEELRAAEKKLEGNVFSWSKKRLREIVLEKQKELEKTTKEAMEAAANYRESRETKTILAQLFRPSKIDENERKEEIADAMYHEALELLDHIKPPTKGIGSKREPVKVGKYKQLETSSKTDNHHFVQQVIVKYFGLSGDVRDGLSGAVHRGDHRRHPHLNKKKMQAIIDNAKEKGIEAQYPGLYEVLKKTFDSMHESFCMDPYDFYKTMMDATMQYPETHHALVERVNYKNREFLEMLQEDVRIYAKLAKSISAPEAAEKVDPSTLDPGAKADYYRAKRRVELNEQRKKDLGK